MALSLQFAYALRLAGDVAELVASLACLVGPDRALRSATQALGTTLYTQFLLPFEVASLILLLAVIGALNAAIGAYYYLRVIVFMFMRAKYQPIYTR